MRPLLLSVIVLLLLPTAYAATIHGAVYDMGLNKVENAVVGISTQPVQRMLARNGTYSFQVEPGQYELVAITIENGHITSRSSENVTIREQDGRYRRDLVLFPSFTQEEELLHTNITFSLPEGDKQNKPYIYAAGVLIVILITLWAMRRRKQPTHSTTSPSEQRSEKQDDNKEEGAQNETQPQTQPEGTSTSESSTLPADLQHILSFLRSQGGRATQREIRHQFPESEGKISLRITDLESRGFVRKVKKGRGNIIILNE